MKVHSTKILAICLIVAIAYIYYQDKQQASLMVENRQLFEQLEKANVLLAESEQKVALLEKKSIEGMLKETNKVVVSGWETLLDTVKDELTKAKERFSAEDFTLERFNSDKGQSSSGDALSTPPAPDPLGTEDVEQESLTIEGERT